MKTISQNLEGTREQIRTVEQQTTEAQSANGQSSTDRKDNRLPIDSEARKQNRSLPTPKVLSLLQQLPAAYRLAEVVGKWVWVQFKEQPAAEIRQQLAQLRLSSSADPAPNAPKWFAAVEMVRLATDEDWLHKATKELAKYWRNKRERRLTPAAPPRANESPAAVSFIRRKPASTLDQKRDCPAPAV